MRHVRHHGASVLPDVTVDTYNAELQDEAGYVGDRASSRVFHAMLAERIDRLAALGHDVAAGEPADRIDLGQVDAWLRDGTPDQAGLVHGVVETFAHAFADVLGRFLGLPGWQGTERIVVGGGLRDSHAGELAIARAAVLLRGAGHDLQLQPIRHHPDEAGLLGGLFLTARQALAGHDAILAMDIGGTNVRAGVVVHGMDQAPDLSASRVAIHTLWRHREEKPSREQAVARFVDLLRELMRQADAAGLRLAPLVTVGCPGTVAPDGSIERGGQNLPGDWEHPTFNLPRTLLQAIPAIGGHPTDVIMHNDAIVQGLSEIPWSPDTSRWGVVTIGTGLGNARFTNRDGP